MASRTARFDNLKPAVTKILVGSERELSPRFVAMANHYLVEPCFARPRTGHDKGGVEARGKGIRWQHLVPIPSGPDLGTISGELLTRLDARAATKRDVERRTVAERFVDEQARMLPLAATPFARRSCITRASGVAASCASRARFTRCGPSGPVSTYARLRAPTRSSEMVEPRRALRRASSGARRQEADRLSPLRVPET